MYRTSQTVAQYDAIAKIYDQKQELMFPEVEAKKFVGLLARGSTILDLGCAGGRDVKRFSDMGFVATGIDLSIKLLEIARKKYPQLSFLQADMTHLPFSDSSFNAIWASGVLHHVDKEDMLSALQEWYRVLKKNGFIMIATKMGEGQLKIKESLSSQQEREFTLLMPRELNSMLIESSFKKVELYTYNETKRRKTGRDLWWLVGIYRK